MCGVMERLMCYILFEGTDGNRGTYGSRRTLKARKGQS